MRWAPFLPRLDVLDAKSLRGLGYSSNESSLNGALGFLRIIGVYPDSNGALPLSGAPYPEAIIRGGMYPQPNLADHSSCQVPGESEPEWTE
jgi:hypothetical protein